MNRLGIFCSYNEKIIGGQTTKTIELLNAANKYFEHVAVLNQKREKSYTHLLKSFVHLFRENQNIVIIVASSGYFRLLPFIAIISCFYNRNIYEITIGGIRHEYIKRKKWSLPIIKKFKKIYVESTYMIKEYHKLGIKNVEQMENYKTFPEITEEELNLKLNRKYFKMCTFSRVDSNKGIDTAIKICKYLHEEYDNPNIILDIYGPVEEGYKVEFEKLLILQPKYISYKGVVDNRLSINTLKDYDCLLCPTKWHAEGFPGAFIDALASGLPILAAKRETFKDIIEDGKNGFLIPENNIKQYAEQIMDWYRNRDELLEAKRNALRESKKYQTDIVLKKMFMDIDNTI